MPAPVRFGDHVVLIEGSADIFRAHHTQGNLQHSDGRPIGAVRGFCELLSGTLANDDIVGGATHAAVIFDRSRDTFRKKIYPEYKSNREKIPDALRAQLPLIREAVEAFGLRHVDQDGYEADDLIATYAEQAFVAGADVTIVCLDKDMMQLVRPGVRLYSTHKDWRCWVTEERILKKFGVQPAQVIDVQALAGDRDDFVPGVPGIGIKTAAALISEFGSLETLLANAAAVKGRSTSAALERHADQARLSRQLVELCRTVPVDVPLDEFAVQPFNQARRDEFFDRMGFVDRRRMAGRIAA